MGGSRGHVAGHCVWSPGATQAFLLKAWHGAVPQACVPGAKGYRWRRGSLCVVGGQDVLVGGPSNPSPNSGPDPEPDPVETNLWTNPNPAPTLILATRTTDSPRPHNLDPDLNHARGRRCLRLRGCAPPRSAQLRPLHDYLPTDTSFASLQQTSLKT